MKKETNNQEAKMKNKAIKYKAIHKRTGEVREFLVMRKAEAVIVANALPNHVVEKVASVIDNKNILVNRKYRWLRWKTKQTHKMRIREH